jgi:hypothetical protein
MSIGNNSNRPGDRFEATKDTRGRWRVVNARTGGRQAFTENGKSVVKTTSRAVAESVARALTEANRIKR